MSSQSSPRLLNLPTEIVERVIRQIGDRSDLSNVRLTCKTLDTFAAKEIFKDVFVSPAEEHVKKWNSISQSDAIRRMPRHAIIHTQPDIEDHGMGFDREREDVGVQFLDALGALSKFPNLESAEIGFTPECMGADHESYQEVAEDASQRQDMLERIFCAIKERSTNMDNRTIRQLTITNLQNCPLPDFTSSGLFLDVMSHLEELHISMTHEFNEHGPDDDYRKVELQTFPAYFCSDWLKPISMNLKALSIYHERENWGPFPGYFDPSGISFPRLEKLALGYYTLAHDKDLDWILAIKSLRKLILQNCMIISRMRFTLDNMETWKPSTHDWTRVPDEFHNSWCEEFTYGGKWSQYLERIVESLPNLTDFRFDTGVGAMASVNNRDSCGVRISPQRYIVFNDGILPTHWLEADDDDGEMVDGSTNMHEENLDVDQESLDKLIRKCRNRNFE